MCLSSLGMMHSYLKCYTGPFLIYLISLIQFVKSTLLAIVIKMAQTGYDDDADMIAGQSRKAKQRYLQEEILEGGYDP